MIRTKSIHCYLLNILFLTIIFNSCKTEIKNRSNISNILPDEITVRDDQFVDNFGRQVFLNGINIVSKNKDEGYIYQSGSELYKNLNKWGVNCIRFIIIWDRLESEPGVYNEEYLKEIDQRIAWAAENNVFVVLDMHQDLYSVKYSDGAPEWATLDEGKPHTTGAIWSDAYMMSKAVQTSFDNFWLNKPAPDGMGIQDHYIALWKHIAKRYANNKTVIGYDIMNEPFPGSSGIQSSIILLTAYGQLHFKLTGEVLSEEQLAAMWSSEEGKMEALNILSDKENYDFVFSQLNDLVRQFEANHLQEMYQKVSSAIREVDQNHVLFLEHSYFGNTGVASSIERVNLPDGSPDPLVAYAPHGYDLVTDTDAVALASRERVEYIYNQIKKKGTELKMPVWLGEWGAFYGNSESVIPVAKSSINLIEKHLFGQAYWSYYPEAEKMEYFKQALIRAYPTFINGKLIEYNNDFNAAKFIMVWLESEEIDAPTVVFIPYLSKLNQEKLNEFTIQKIKDSDAAYLIIPKLASEGIRKLKLSFLK